MKKAYDIIIIGGGLVGASLALTLAEHNLAIALLERKPIPDHSVKSDTKSIVLSYGSRIILESIGVWPLLEPEICPVRQIHVSDRGHFGITRINAEEENVSALGYVILSSHMSSALFKALQRTSNIDLIQGEFISFTKDAQKTLATIKVHDEVHELVTQLIVAADGQSSPIRQQLNIVTDTYDYQQVAVTCQVNLQKRHTHVAFERFTRDGPLALLPVSKNTYSVIWTINKHKVSNFMQLNDELFLQKLQQSFGYRLGRLLTPSARVAFPLQLTFAKEQTRPGVVLIGNAAHTLHPIAGQGLNLGLRDMAVLAEEILLAKKNNLNFGDTRLLTNYVHRRKNDQQSIIALTHNLVGVFSNAVLPMIFARNSGLFLMDIFPAFKKLLTRRAMGLAGKAPRLACGLSLEANS